MMKFEFAEGATPIGPDEVEGLILTHITTQGELNRWEQDNILEAIVWLEKVKPTNILNEKFIKTLHQRMFKNVWKWAGKYRQSDKTIGGSWPHIPTDLKNLCDDAVYWIELEVPSDLIGARFHHRLVSIHPFPNGNGRHAREMTNLLMKNILKHPEFTWGRGNLAQVGDLRERYIGFLPEADKGNYEPLLKFLRT